MYLTANPPFGVKALKEFLSYAENLTLGTEIKEQYSKEPFEDAIYNFLIENGYQVDKQIGYAGFRVDLAIVDEENPGKYILGITTDGKMYFSSKVARDRDRLREQVLTGLGWRLYHLWSTDWYRNRDLGRKKLLDFVERAIKDYRSEEKRKSEEAKRLAKERQKEAEIKAEELRLARERELAEEEQIESENNEDFDVSGNCSSDFVELEYDDETDDLNFKKDETPSDDSGFQVDDLEEDNSNSIDVETPNDESKNNNSPDDKEIWESKEDNNDFNVNAEIWEDISENTSNENQSSKKDWIKSHLKPNDNGDKKTISDSLKFTKKLDNDLEDELANDAVEEVINDVNNDRDELNKIKNSVDTGEDVFFGSSVTMDENNKSLKSKSIKKNFKPNLIILKPIKMMIR